MDELISPTRIVVAVDGSEHATRAVRWAARQACLEHRGLVVVSVADVGRHAIRDSFRALVGPALRDEARHRAEDAAALARGAAPAAAVDPLVLEGDPREVIVSCSRRSHLLVLGSRGRGSASSTLLGSVSAGVCKRAFCPVVVCRPPATADAPSKGVVVGADGTPESRSVIEFAARQASLRGLPLTVVHTFWDAVVAVERMPGRAAPAAHSATLSPRLDDLRVALATSVAGLAETYPEVRLDLRLAHGLVDEVILGDRSAWEMLVVGRHPWSSLRRWLTGSIAMSLLERAHGTVAIVPEPEVTA